MFQNHPTVEQLSRFLQIPSGYSKRASDIVIVRHLLAECPDCRRQLESMGWPEARLARLLLVSGPQSQDFANPSWKGFEYRDVFERTEAIVSSFFSQLPPLQERPEVLLEELEAQPFEDQLAAMKREVFSHPSFLLFLIHRSHDLRYRDTERMLRLAQLACRGAEACRSERAGGSWRLADLRAHGWRQFGNALRVRGKLQEAEEAFDKAQAYRDRGTGDPTLHAWLLEQMASLRIFQRRFPRAIELAESAGQIYRRLGDLDSLASTLVQKAIACVYDGDPERAIGILNQAIPLMDQEKDPYLLLAACQNLVICYLDLERPEQALALYLEARDLYKEFKDEMILLRMTWQEGRLLRDLGHLAGAEMALQQARDGFVARELGYEAAMVSLDLAAVYIQMGRLEGLEHTIAATIPIFRSLRVDRETLAALLQIRKVAEQRTQALDLIRTVTSQVERLSKESSARKP